MDTNIADNTIASQLSQFAKSFPIDPDTYDDVYDFISGYITEMLGMKYYHVMVAGKNVSGMAGLETARVTRRLWCNDGADSAPIHANGASIYRAQSTFAYAQQKPIWVTAKNKGSLHSESEYEEQWSGIDPGLLPHYYNGEKKDIKTSIVVPLLLGMGHVLGVLCLENTSHIDITEDAKTDLLKLADSIGSILSSMEDYEKKKSLSRTAFKQVQDFYREQQFSPLSKPIADNSIASQLSQFAKSFPIDPDTYDDVYHLISGYITMTLGMKYYHVMVDGTNVNGMPGLGTARVTHHPWCNDGADSVPIYANRASTYTTQSTFAYAQQKPVCVTAKNKGSLHSESEYEEQWSGIDPGLLPHYYNGEKKDIKTSIVVPLPHGMGHVFGVLCLENTSYIDITEDAKTDLLKLADSIGSILSSMEDYEKKKSLSRTAFKQVQDFYREQQFSPLSKPKVYTEPRKILLPDIDWVEIPAGPFVYGEDDSRREIHLERFLISRYPITNSQYQVFIDAGGYTEKRWWQNLTKPVPEKSTWHQPNRPRTDVDWYEAVAFTRWVSAQLNQPVRLPTEQEWEKAARGTDGRNYPWGDAHISGYANVAESLEKGEYLGQTTAVGLFPQGRSAYGVMDMSGNVWEWCLNKAGHPEQIEPGTSGDFRVLRGGCWIHDPEDARAADRDRYYPGNRNSGGGFRVVLSATIF